MNCTGDKACVFPTVLNTGLCVNHLRDKRDATTGIYAKVDIPNVPDIVKLTQDGRRKNVDWEAAQRDRDDGRMTQKEICKKYDVSVQTLCKHTSGKGTRHSQIIPQKSYPGPVQETNKSIKDIRQNLLNQKDALLLRIETIEKKIEDCDVIVNLTNKLLKEEEKI